MFSSLQFLLRGLHQQRSQLSCNWKISSGTTGTLKTRRPLKLQSTKQSELKVHLPACSVVFDRNTRLELLLGGTGRGAAQTLHYSERFFRVNAGRKVELLAPLMQPVRSGNPSVLFRGHGQTSHLMWRTCWYKRMYRLYINHYYP